MKNLVTVALLSTAIVSGAAYAQTAQPADRAAPAATTSPAASSDKMMLKGKWRASKLMGLDVYNEANEKLGDVNELIVDKDGKVRRRGDRRRRLPGHGRARHRRHHGQAEIRRGARPHQLHCDHDARNHDRHRHGAGQHHQTTRTNNANDWTPDHAVMSGNKEQLKALPQFKYSDYN